MDHPVDEGLLTANRIRELELFPVVGRFDRTHLQTIHRRIFQDLPYHHPGQFRGDARQLEAGERYDVPYAPRRILESGLAQVFNDLHGPDGLRGLSLDHFAARMAQFYAELDWLIRTFDVERMIGEF